jgi:putative DNA primase/helicase
LSAIDQAVAQMRADGMPEFPPGHPKVGVGKITRYGPNSTGWYRLEVFRTRGGSDVIVGAYGNWKTGLKAKIEPDWKGIGAEERAELEARVREADTREREKRAERAHNASNRAREQWKGARTIEQALERGPYPSPYLGRKQVEPEACRFFDDGTVLVPCVLMDTADTSRLVGLQKIAPDGSKRFTKNASMEGATCRLGAAPADGDVLLVCEGYATGLSIRAATRRMIPVFVAFNAGNLKAVAQILRARYPASPLVFCADDDWKTEVPKGTPFNPGVVFAQAAARAVGRAWVSVPLFVSATREDKWTDFNDLQIAHGLDAVAMQLDVPKLIADIAPVDPPGVIASAPPSSSSPAPDNSDPPPWHDAPRNEQATQTKKRARDPDDDDFAWLPAGVYLHRHKGVLGDLHNSFLFLAHHPEWEGVLAYDLFGEMVVKLKAPPYEGGEVGEWKDLDDTRTLLWLSQSMKEPPDKTVRQAVVLAAHRHEFNKVRDYLEQCEAAWDGVPRLGTWLADYLGAAKDPEFATLPREEQDRVLQYNELVGRKWMIAGAARALAPGCRVDNMMILEGLQGMQKSAALRTLAGEWFTDARLDFSNKDTLLILQGRWIIEMPELEGMNKADTSETKRFLTQHEDLFRPPYGQKLVKAPRRCIFSGTVNHDTYLKDDSGNRRFLPVRCTEIRLEDLARDRDQLWGEAVRLYRDGVAWWVQPSERHLFEEQQDLRFQLDAWEGPIRAWLDGHNADMDAKRRAKVYVGELLGGAIGIDKARWDRQAMMRVGSIMRRLGWPRRRDPSPPRNWFYERPAELELARAPDAAPAQAPQGGKGEDLEPF